MTNLVYLGFIKKTHGFKGVVKVHIENSELIFNQKEPFMLEINKKPVPFFIEHLSKSDKECQVKFEDINSVDEAEEILGLSVFIESNQTTTEEEFLNNDTVGFRIIDKNLGPIGQVIEHIEKPGQDILEISFNNKSFFIPYVEEIITGFNEDEQILYTDLPEGLISIND